MKKKFRKLSLWSLVLALAIFVFSYFLYHYVLPDGTVTTVYQKDVGKPLITELFSILGTLFLFSSILSGMIAKIFFPEKEESEKI